MKLKYFFLLILPFIFLFFCWITVKADIVPPPWDPPGGEPTIIAYGFPFLWQAQGDWPFRIAISIKPLILDFFIYLAVVSLIGFLLKNTIKASLTSRYLVIPLWIAALPSIYVVGVTFFIDTSFVDQISLLGVSIQNYQFHLGYW